MLPPTIIDEDQILRGLITAFSAGQLRVPHPHVNFEVTGQDILHTLIEARRRLEPELQRATRSIAIDECGQEVPSFLARAAEKLQTGPEGAGITQRKLEEWKASGQVLYFVRPPIDQAGQEK